MEQMHSVEGGTYNFIYPTAFQAHAEKGTLHYGEMLAAEDWKKFVKAMQKEVDWLKDILELVPQSSVPSNNNSLPAVWPFKWKRLLG